MTGLPGAGKTVSLAVLLFTAAVFAAEGQMTHPENTEASSTPDDKDLESEASQEGVSRAPEAFFTTRMKEFDKEYQEGSLTKTEYIQRKRELINLGRTRKRIQRCGI